MNPRNVIAKQLWKTQSGYAYLPDGENRSCICMAYLGASPKEVFPDAVDCSGEDEWPDVFFGCSPKEVRLYPEDGSLSGSTFPLLAEHRVVSATSFDVYAMNGDIPAGCEPVASMSFEAPYEDRWTSYPGICGVETNDYRAVNDFYHPDVRKSYIDFYRIHDGEASASVSALRSFRYDPLSVPPFFTHYISRTTDYHSWEVSVRGYQGYQDQDGDVARIQVSHTSDFSTIDFETTGIPHMDDRGYALSTDSPITLNLSLNRGTIYYARSRYESSDGSVLGPWSNVFELNGDAPVSRVNLYQSSGYVLVNETHYFGDRITFRISSNPLSVDGHTYVLLGKDISRRQGASSDGFYSSLYLADYDGTTVTMHEIMPEVHDSTGILYLGQPTVYDIVLFHGKIYAGWYDTPDSSISIFDWCEITGGVVGTVHHVAPPPDSKCWVNWATLVQLYDSLCVVSGIDIGSAYVLGIADILAEDAEMVLYPEIETGWDCVHDPWRHSIWFDSESYDGDVTGIYWLSIERTSSFPWVGRFQLSHVA